MPQKSHAGNSPANDESDKATPVKALHFSQLVRWPGFAGSGSSIIVGPPDSVISAANTIWCDTIFEYRGRFCINGRFWVPVTAGALLSWEY